MIEELTKNQLLLEGDRSGGWSSTGCTSVFVKNVAPHRWSQTGQVSTNAWCSCGNMDTSQFDYNVYYKRADIMSKSTCDTPALSFIEHKFTLNENFAIDQKSGVPWKSHWGCIALRLNWICARLISSHILKVEQWPPFGKNSQIIP